MAIFYRSSSSTTAGAKPCGATRSTIASRTTRHLPSGRCRRLSARSIGCKQARAADPLHIMPASDVRDNEFVPGHLTGYNFLALMG